MRFESKVAVKSMIYKNYDGTTDRFVRKEYTLRRVFLFIYVFLMLLGSGFYINSCVVTQLFNVGYWRISGI